MTTLQSALANLRKCEAKFDFHMKHPGDDGAFTEVIQNLISATEVAWNVHDSTDLGRVVLFSAMKVAKKLLVDLYYYLSSNNLLERIFIIHPDPELLSNAAYYSIWCRDKKLQEFAHNTSQKAIELGGFIALDRVGEMLRDFDTDRAPAHSLCTQLLTNTFRNLDLFVAGDHYNANAIRYISVLLSKIIDEGDPAWAFRFIEENLESIERVCPILFSRIGNLEQVIYQDKFLVNLLDYVKTERLYSFLAQIDNDAYQRMLSQPEVLKMIVIGALSRSDFDLSKVPLHSSIVKVIFDLALKRNFKGLSLDSTPIRLIDIERIQAAHVNSGLSPASFHKKLAGHDYGKMALASFSSLVADISSARVKTSSYPEDLKVFFEKYREKPLGFCILSYYLDSNHQSQVEKNLAIVSGLYASQGHDLFDFLGIPRDKVFLEDFIALSTSSSISEVSDLAEKWMDSGVLLSEASRYEVRRLPKQNLAGLVKRASDVFTPEELRKISWTDDSITEGLIGEDLGL